MKKTLLLVQIFLFSFFGSLTAQEYFEGQIDYKVEYKSLDNDIPTEFLSYALGDSFTAYIKEDKYIIIFNTKAEQGWTKAIIRLDEGYQYVEYEKTDTIYRSKLDTIDSKLIEIKKNEDQRKLILGEECPSITLKYESTDPDAVFKKTDGTHYYNPKYRLNPKKYKNYKSEFWNMYVEMSEAISIRNEHIYEGLFESVSEATAINERKIPDDLFVLNSNKVLIENE